MMNIDNWELELGDCSNCPNACALVSDVDGLEIRKNMLAHLALDAMKVSDDLDPELSDVLIDITMSQRAYMDKQIDIAKENLQNLTNGCEGPALATARKLGRFFCVTVCNSSLTPDGTFSEKTQVYREQKITDS